MAKKSEQECQEIVKKAYCCASGGARIVFDNSDRGAFSKILFSAKETGNNETFPDFVCDGAIIEHFQITSSRETRKGSDFLANASKSNATWEEEFKREKELFERSEFHPGTMTTFASEDRFAMLSYEAFLKSMKIHIDDHIGSLRKSGIVGKKVVFMMDQRDARLCTDLSDAHCVFYVLSKDRKPCETLRNTRASSITSSTRLRMPWR